MIGGTPHELKQYDTVGEAEIGEAGIDSQMKERMKLGVFESAAVTWPSDHFGLIIDVGVLGSS